MRGSIDLNRWTNKEQLGRHSGCNKEEVAVDGVQELLRKPKKYDGGFFAQIALFSVFFVKINSSVIL